MSMDALARSWEDRWLEREKVGTIARRKKRFLTDWQWSVKPFYIVVGSPPSLTLTCLVPGNPGQKNAIGSPAVRVPNVDRKQMI